MLYQVRKEDVLDGLRAYVVISITLCVSAMLCAKKSDSCI